MFLGLNIHEVKDMRLLKFLFYQILCKYECRIEGKGKVVPYKGALITIQPTGKILTNGLFKVGANKIPGSKAETWLRIGAGSVLKVNGDFSVYSQNDIRVFDKGQLILGSGYINQGGVISCAKSITIGNGVKIARQVFIYDNDFHKIKDSDNRVMNESKPIVIGNHVWIGGKATILKGVTVGDGAIIAANSLVNRDVPPRCMVAGNPARVIRENVIWE